MSRGIPGIVLVLFAALACGSTDQGRSSARYPSLREVLEQAAVVARVRIVDQKPLKFEVSDTVYECGLALKAEVVDGIIGSREPFWFFLARKRDYDPNEEEHLVVVESNSPEKAEARLALVSSYISKFDAEHVRCAASVPYSAALSVQALLPFDKVAASVFGSEWLRPNRMSIAHLAEVELREMEVGGSPSSVFNWPDLRRAIAAVQK